MTIKEQLQNLLEDDLRKKIIIPLMRAFGALNVRDWHGRSERGIDVLYKKENDFNETIYKGILLRAHEINIHEFDTSIRRKIEDAIGRPFVDPDSPENVIKIYGLVVITSFNITQDVRDLINECARKYFPSIDIVDGDKLCGFIDRIIDEYNKRQNEQSPNPNYYTFKVDTFQEFCEMYRSQIYSRKSLILNYER